MSQTFFEMPEITGKKVRLEAAPQAQHRGRGVDPGLAVVAVNYRLYPKVKCPVYIEDAAAAAELS